MSTVPEGPAPNSAESGPGSAHAAAAAPPADDEPAAGARAGLEAELRSWQALVEQTLEAGNQFLRLVILELKLAAGDGRRLLFVALAIVPVVIFTWLGLGVLLAWLVYVVCGSVALGLVAFTAAQMSALVVLWVAARRYTRTLTLPATRRQLRSMMEMGNDDKPQAKGS